MQPHANLGIRFRTHFEPLGYSPKRSREVREKNLIRQKITETRKSVQDLPGVVTIKSQEVIRELRKVLRHYA